MKKALVAAAVAGALAAPSAMAADLKISMEWGQALAFGETTTTTVAGVNNTVDIQEVTDAGRNRLKFLWDETLDNGLAVHARMVFNVAGTSNAGAVSIRNAYIGLTGDFGSIKVGTEEHFFEVDLITDPLGADYNRTSDPILSLNLGNTGFSFTRRDSESVWWTSKPMNGFMARAAYIMGPASGDGAPTAGADQDGMQVGLSYMTGPMRIDVSQATYNDYANTGAEDVAPVAGSEATATSLKVAYDFGTFKVIGAVWNMEQTGITFTDSSGDAATAVEASGQSLNFEMPVAGGMVWAAMSSIGDQDTTTAAGSAAINDSGKDGWDIGYLHNMSAQTYVFVRYGTSETGLNFNADAGGNTSSETDELLIGWLLNY
ncbi:porin [Burkholderiales bacterium]|nr:porin [Burkholderiales bacterium]